MTPQFRKASDIWKKTHFNEYRKNTSKAFSMKMKNTSTLKKKTSRPSNLLKHSHIFILSVVPFHLYVKQVSCALAECIDETH